ncbi:MAG: hypothetical protein HZA29_02615 [Candidatus Omnitrophica bacterium]|nr:hypothetical protein [Candidatus Omnitrophota bacterium]
MECQNKCGLNKQLSYFQKAVFYDPNLTDAYYQLGIIYGEKGQNGKESTSYKKVAALDYANADAYFKTGLHYFSKGEFDYALRYFLQSDRYDPNSDDMVYYMAETYYKKKMYREAVFHYMRIISRRSPLSVEACERIWRISKIPDQYGMVSDEVHKIRDNKEQEKLWEQIDQYLKTDQVPEFMRESGE